MLIAIMGDSFSRVMENKEVYATQTKLELLNDMATVLQRSSKEQEDKVYLFLVRPDADDENAGAEWEGVVNKMTRITASNIKQLGVQLNKKTDKLQDQITDFIKRDATQEKHMKAHIDKVTKASQDEITRQNKHLERLIKYQGRDAGKDEP